MQHLRIMGVTEEGSDETLVLADEGGQEYALPVDEALRASVGRRSTRPPHLTTRAEDARAPMTVREVQARLRAGATVEQMVAESGLDPARVERYAGPVQAERAYIAERARGTQIAPPSSTEQHRIAFGDAPATLQAMVMVRLRALDVNLGSLTWDAWRRQDGNWQILCWFDADDLAAGRARVDADPPAEWVFSPYSRHLRGVGPWAQTLSTLPPETGPRRGPRRLTAVDAPFDVESPGEQPQPRRQPEPPADPAPADEQVTSPLDGAAPVTAAARPAGPATEGDEHEDLLDVLRARRGQRLGTDEEADDKLALMLTREEQPAGQDGPRLRAVDPQHVDPQHEGEPTGDGAEEAGTDAWGFSYTDAENPPSAAEAETGAPTAETQEEHAAEEHAAPQDEARQDEADPDASAPEAELPAEDEPTDRSRARRSGSRRPNMPRWDDILFGSKGD